MVQKSIHSIVNLYTDENKELKPTEKQSTGKKDEYRNNKCPM